MRGEIYRPIPGFLGWYDVSESGNVRSLSTQGKGRRVPRRQPFPLKQYESFGYLRVQLSRPWRRSNDRGGRYNVGVHRLVALAFIDPFPEDDLVVSHLDGDPRNNHWANLEFVAQEENLSRRESHGTVPRGSSHYNSVPYEACLQIFQLRYDYPQKPLAEIYREAGVSTGSGHRALRLQTENARIAYETIWREADDLCRLIGISK